MKNKNLWRMLLPTFAATAICAQVAGAVEIPALDCVIEPFEVAEVSSAAEGVIETIYVERNDLVEEGQVLAELESDVEKASLAFAHLNASLDTEIKLRRASFDFDQRNRDRINELYAKKAIPLHHKDEADTDEAKSRWLLMKARDDQRLAALELARATAVVKRKTVRSPIAGVVVARHKSAGEYIEDQAIMTVAQLHPLKVEVIAPVELFGSIESGMSAEIFPELASSGNHTAKVISVDRVIDGASGTFDVHLELPNPDYRIPSGLKCQIEFDNQAAAIESVNGAPEEPGREALRKRAAAGNEPVALPSTAEAACTAIGPLSSGVEAEQVTLALRKFATRITPARQVETVIDGHLVVAPLSETGAEAARLQERIVANEVTATNVIESGQFEGQISFGVYNDKRRAERRRLAMEKLGIRADLKPRLKQQARIWLEVEAADADLSAVKILQVAARANPESDLDVAPCGYPEAAPGDVLALKNSTATAPDTAPTMR